MVTHLQNRVEIADCLAIAAERAGFLLPARNHLVFGFLVVKFTFEEKTCIGLFDVQVCKNDRFRSGHVHSQVRRQGSLPCSTLPAGDGDFHSLVSAVGLMVVGAVIAEIGTRLKLVTQEPRPRPVMGPLPSGPLLSLLAMMLFPSVAMVSCATTAMTKPVCEIDEVRRTTVRALSLTRVDGYIQ